MTAVFFDWLPLIVFFTVLIWVALASGDGADAFLIAILAAGVTALGTH
jgi:hypothetical protein